LKESVKSLPNTKEAFLAAVPKPVICEALNPAALAMAVACAASLYFNCPSVASCNARLIPLKEVPVTAPYCSCAAIRLLRFAASLRNPKAAVTAKI